jgi:hypothetical protein
MLQFRFLDMVVTITIIDVALWIVLGMCCFVICHEIHNRFCKGEE